jgi:hypothetical protein
MAGAGIFALVALLIAAPFLIAKDYFAKFRLLNPRQQALMRVSHGAGMLALGVWAFFMRDAIGLTPFGQWVPLALLAVAGGGLFRLCGGWKDAKIYSEQPGDDFLIARAIVKAGVGVGARLLLDHGYKFLDRDMWGLVVDFQWIIAVVMVWCFATGCAKFAVLLAVKKGRAPLRPPVHPTPYGPGRPALPGEGPKKSNIDNMKF